MRTFAVCVANKNTAMKPNVIDANEVFREHHIQ
jgi:hypothetical protein